MNGTRPPERRGREEIVGFVLARVQRKARLPRGADPDHFDFLEAGLIDSMGILKFILEIEAEFDIALEEDDLMGAQFRTVGGLATLIESKLA